jgi:flavin reductase (DIM6/NTAB) family NADH-FMN oxidoreductase RutF
MTVDSQTFRQTLGSFATGVTIVTTQDPASQKPVGVTVSAFSSVSLDPPLVLFCLGKHSTSHLAFNTNGHFAVNFLAEDQAELSNRFASKLEDKFEGIDYTKGIGNVPVLASSIAHLECTMNKVFDGGDHHIFVGLVEAAGFKPESKPLLYYRGKYAALSGDVK